MVAGHHHRSVVWQVRLTSCFFIFFLSFCKNRIQVPVNCRLLKIIPIVSSCSDSLGIVQVCHTACTIAIFLFILCSLLLKISGN
jgi:hypothetical protein